MRAKLVAAGLALAIFAGGLVSGVVIERYMLADDEAAVAIPERRGRHDRQLARFRDRLHLSDAQARAIDEILTRTRDQTATTRKHSQAEIMAILTPEQARKYKKMISRREKRRHHRGAGRRRGPGPGPGGPPPRHGR